MLSRALIPVHFGEPKHKLAKLSGALRTLGITDILLLHVGDRPSPEVQADASTTKTAARMAAIEQTFKEEGFAPEIHYAHGSPALTITRMSEELGCDLIAFCWKAKNWLQRALVGSTTLDVIRLSDVSVLVVKDTTLDGMLYATDFHSADRSVISHLNTEPLTDYPRYLVHVGERAPDPVAETEREDLALANLRRLASECRGRPVEVRLVQDTNVSRGILREARKNSAGTIVLGKSKGDPGLSSVLGSTAERVTTNARCSVLIVPPGA
ncbi:MAG: universal stress protein [Spirochaetales bacterium]